VKCSLASHSMRGEALKGQLDMLVLAVLAEGPRHGYAVIEILRARSGDAFDLPEGTVYPVLRRLDEAGLLDSDWNEVRGRRRRTYRLTERGRAALVEQAWAWEKFAGAVGTVLRGVPWPSTT
jgi:PadR family transcriptional regulator PadR